MVTAIRGAWQAAKPWQAVLIDWASEAPMVSGDPIGRYWTRASARRAADRYTLRQIPMQLTNRYRCTDLPTRAPSVV